MQFTKGELESKKTYGLYARLAKVHGGRVVADYARKRYLHETGRRFGEKANYRNFFAAQIKERDDSGSGSAAETGSAMVTGRMPNMDTSGMGLWHWWNSAVWNTVQQYMMMSVCVPPVGCLWDRQMRRLFVNPVATAVHIAAEGQYATSTDAQQHAENDAEQSHSESEDDFLSCEGSESCDSDDDYVESDSCSHRDAQFHWDSVFDPVRDGLEEQGFQGRMRAAREKGMTLPQARLVDGYPMFEAFCSNLSVRATEVLDRQSAGAELTGNYLNEHTQARILRRLLVLIPGCVHVLDVCKLEHCRAICSSLLDRLKNGVSPKTILNNLNAYAGVVDRLDEFLKAGEFSGGIRNDILEQVNVGGCLAKISLSRDVVRPLAAIPEQSHHHQDHWESLGRWVGEDDWVAFGKILLKRMELFKQRWSPDNGKNMAVCIAFQSFLLVALSVLAPTLRAQVYLNLKTSDFRTNALKITRDKSTVSRTVEQSTGRAFRYVPVNPILGGFLTFWINEMRPVHLDGDHDYLFRV